MSGDYDDSIVREYTDMVNQVASEYHRKYPMVERQDLSQHLWMWFWEHPKKTAEWRNLENRKESDSLIAKSLRNYAYEICRKEKAHAEGYSVEDIFYYRKDFVKAMIPAILSDNWQKIEGALSTTGRSRKSLAESDDWLAHSADIKAAFDKLSEKEQNLVFLFYGEDVDATTLHEQALPEKSTKRAAAMQANRALQKMVRNLGGFPPYKDYDYTEEDLHVQQEIEEDQSPTDTGE